MKRRRLKFVLKNKGNKIIYFRNVDFSELSHGGGKSFDTVSEDIFSDDFMN